jgi:hypothetical protein
LGLGALALPAREAVVHDASVAVPGVWAPWLGVLVFGVATAFYFSAPEGALPGCCSSCSPHGSGGWPATSSSAAASSGRRR